MAKLSRVQKYQELRDRLEQDTTEQVKDTTIPAVEGESLTHASQPTHPHEDVEVTPNSSEMPTSNIMDNVMEEVRQYNLDNGNSVSDDTQINILQQLNGAESMHRNQHFVPMEEEEEELGSTMDLSNIEAVEIDKTEVVEEEEEPFIPKPTTDFAALQTPVMEELEEDKEKEPDVLQFNEDTIPVENVNEKEEKTQDKIILTSADIPTEIVYEDEEEELPEIDEEQQRELARQEAKARKKKEKAEKKAKKKAAKNKKPNQMPSEAIRDQKAKPKQNKAGKILNVILVVLIILLIIAIGFTVYFIKNLGM